MRLEHRVVPGRPVLWCRDTDSVLAMSDGFFSRTDLLVGDLLWFEDSLSTLLYAVSPRPGVSPDRRRDGGQKMDGVARGVVERALRGGDPRRGRFARQERRGVQAQRG